MWANLAQGVLMAMQAATEIDRYWSKFATDIPFVLVLALGIYLWWRTDRSLLPAGPVDRQITNTY